MSRSYCSYDEDWQRRKSVLIRSLFHDVPILSPVEEESNDSSHDYYFPTQEVFPSPPRPYSPLPPLIIEKIPIANKHDEPEEYYRKLHKRIRRIYERLFVEKRNVSSVDFDSNCNDSSVNDNNEYNTEGSVENLVYETENNSVENDNFESIIEDRETRKSSASTKSNGYGADFESMDTAVIDVVNNTLSNEDIIMISEEEESENANIDEDGIRYEDYGNCRPSRNKESSAERMDDGAFSEHSHHNTVNNQETTEIEESDETEIEQNYETEGSDNEIIEETSQTRQSNTLVIVDLEVSKGEKSHHSIIDDQEITKSDKSNKKEYTVIKADRNSDNQVSRWEEFKRTGSVGRNESVVSNNEPKEADVETSESSEGPHYRQITTEALIHFDGCQVPGERESIVYEDSVKSIILPTRYTRVLASRNVDVEDRIEVYVVLEENADPKIASDFDESETTEETLEEETTSYPDTTFENDEEMSTHQDAVEENDEEMSDLQPDASDRNFKEIGTLHTGAIEENDEEMGARQSEIDTNQPDATNKEMEETRNLDSDDTDEENESWHQPNDVREYIGAMRAPELDTIEEDDEEMSSHQAEEDVEVDIEKTGTTSSDATGNNFEEISVHQLVADEDTEAKRSSPRLDECDIDEMTPTQRDPTIEANLEKETAHPNTTDEEIRTRIPETNEKGIKTTIPETTWEEIEQMRTPRPDLSHGTISVTHRSSSTSSAEHTAHPQELSVLTSSIQDGADHNMSELQTSNDMNEILTSIFNESQNKDGTRISERKRKLVDKSVQAVETSRVTWEEMRANFFVGTPKIFRLCACTDHICS